MKRYMDSNVQDNFYVKRIYTESQDKRPKYIRGSYSSTNTLTISKIISYNPFE